MDMKQEHCKICGINCEPWIIIKKGSICFDCYQEIIDKSRDFYEDIYE